jgi:phage terminase large subunit
MSLTARVKKMIAEAEEGIRVMYPTDITEWTKYRPRELQKVMQDEMRRFNSWCVHRRFGKSKMASHIIVDRAVDCPFKDGNYGYVAPTFDQVERICWKYIKEYLEKFPRVKIWDSDLIARLPTREGHWAEIGLYGVDSPKQRLRGSYFDGVVLDEWQDIPPHVWFEQVRPMLADAERAGVDWRYNPNQWAAFLFTPKGRNHAARMHFRALLWFVGKGAKTEAAEGEEPRTVFRNNWSGFTLPNSVTGILTPDEVDDMRANMDDATFMQEVECSFDAAIKGAIFAKQIADLRERKRITEVKYTNLLPVHTAWDLGYDDATAIWFFQMLGNEPRIIDYYENSQNDLSHYADVLSRRGYRYGKNFFPHDVDVHDLGVGKTRRSVLQSLGIRVTAVPKASNKEDPIAAARLLLPRCYFDEELCQDGLDRLAMYRRDWDPLNSTFRLKPKHDWTSHGADAFMTLAMGIRLAPPSDHTQGKFAEL